jgi:hypothetical protein
MDAKPYPSCESDLLILPASFNRSPAAPVDFCRSDPARSTRLILLVFNLLTPSAALCKYEFTLNPLPDLKLNYRQYNNSQIQVLQETVTKIKKNTE